MAAAAASSSGRVYGVITLDGIDYVERYQLFVTELVINTAFEVHTNQALTLPGVANFLLKGLTRDITQLPGVPNLGVQNFRFRMINSEGTTWFSTGGLGVFDDRAIASMCFGSGQFPFPLIPPVPIHSTGTVVYEVEDLGFLPAPANYPYTIHFGWQGSYLFPAEDAPTRGPLAFPGVTRGIIRTR